MKPEPTCNKSFYKVIVIALFASSFVLLTLTQTYKTNGTIIWENEAIPVSSVATNREISKRERRLSEEDPDFVPPNPHAPYVVAIGSKNSLDLISERKKAGVDTPIIILCNGQENSLGDDKKDYEFVLSLKCGGCHVTRKRKHIDKSLALVFFNDVNLFQMVPPDQTKRSPGQSYVFWSRETPAKTVGHRSKLEKSAFDKLFNLSFFFRRDSDVIQYFGNRESALRISKFSERKLGRKKFLESKTKDALWFVSNCDHTYGATQRLLYAKKLVKEGLRLDKFGKCFSDSERFDSKDIDVTKYRFYLSFENSIHCADYVSEKFWRNGLQSGLVPVVWGPIKEDVEAIAPPNSFIFAKDFETPRDLVMYLRYLSSNTTAYMEYHRWRDADIDESIAEEDISKGPQAAFCRLCKKKVLGSGTTKTIPSIAKWMYDKRYIDDQCYKPKLTPKELERYGSLKSLTRF